MVTVDKENIFNSSKQTKIYILNSLVVAIVVLIGSYFIFDFKNRREETKEGKTEVLSVEKGQETENTDQVQSENLTTKQPKAELAVVTASDEATEALVKKVFNHIFLPSGDVRVETVVKPEELKKINPEFYKFVKEGDKLLIYSDRAILYNPEIDKILEVVHLK